MSLLGPLRSFYWLISASPCDQPLPGSRSRQDRLLDQGGDEAGPQSLDGGGSVVDFRRLDASSPKSLIRDARITVVLSALLLGLGAWNLGRATPSAPSVACSERPSSYGWSIATTGSRGDLAGCERGTRGDATSPASRIDHRFLLVPGAALCPGAAHQGQAGFAADCAREGL